jgi:hypothetical protein
MKRTRLAALTAVAVAVVLALTVAMTATGSSTQSAEVGAPRAVVARSGRPSARLLSEATATLNQYLRQGDPLAQLAPSSPAVPGNSDGPTSLDSYNWSGYADASPSLTTPVPQSFSAVSGSWTVPFVRCTAEDTIEAQWVGLDGFNDQTVEQDGTIDWCFEGQPYYYTWYEMYPSATVAVGTTVQPGDQITASVSVSGTAYTLSLSDATAPANSFSVTESCAATTCLDASAEWIVERPAFSIGIAPLADYGFASFTNATQTSSSGTGSITSIPSSLTSYQLQMIDATGTYLLSTTGSLQSFGGFGGFGGFGRGNHGHGQGQLGSGFSTLWDNSY